MSSKTRCFFLSLVLGTFLAHANVENGKWIFHAKSGPKTYPINGEVRGTPYVLLAPLLKEFSLKSSTPSESEIEISNPKTKFSAKISTKTSKINCR